MAPNSFFNKSWAPRAATALLLLPLALWIVVALFTTKSTPSPGPLTTCQPSQVSAVWVQGSGAAGTILDAISLYNRSHVACTVPSPLRLRTTDDQGNSVPTTHSPASSWIVPASDFITAPREKVLPAKHLYFYVRYGDVQSTAAACPTVLNVTVVLDNYSLDLHPSFALSVCSAALDVSPATKQPPLF